MKLRAFVAIAIGLALTFAVSGPCLASDTIRKDSSGKTVISKTQDHQFHLDCVLPDPYRVYEPNLTYRSVPEAKNNSVVPVASVTARCNGPTSSA